MMGGVTYFLLVYVLGGLTFLPLLVVVLIVHAYLTFPVRETSKEISGDTESNGLLRDGDRSDAVRSASKSLDEKFRSHSSQESDVAAGYFAVCREYVPGGINGKPPERTTPTGSTVVTSPSPSVYQSMYRSIFDRKKDTNPLDIKGVGKPTSRGGNVFYVVLRYDLNWNVNMLVFACAVANNLLDINISYFSTLRSNSKSATCYP